ncbi:MAG: PQQ-binding-like beta-propeller repeat protein [Planctomycetia bacterium]|nr:PQQ-binding-like beta-propeller repeat protein [Planctomycetia bacterium]
MPTQLALDEFLFVVTDNGVAECLDAATGKSLGKRRLGGDFSSSPVLAAGRIYASSEDGHVFVFSADPKLEILAANDMEEPIFATPVISDQRVYLRTLTGLYCIGSSVAL